MSNTYEYGGKVYRIVPDGAVLATSVTPCQRCAFYKNILACKSQPTGSDGDADCIMGNHYYTLDQEQA